jgi:hypothetical protein
VLVVLDADRQARLTTESALVRRFEPDYRAGGVRRRRRSVRVVERLACAVAEGSVTVGSVHRYLAEF